MEPSLSDNVLLAQIKYLKNGQSHFQNHYQYVSQGFQLSPVKWKNRYLFIKHRCVFFGKHVCFLQQHIYILFNEKNGRVWLWDEFGSGEWLGRSCGLDMG